MIRHLLLCACAAFCMSGAAMAKNTPASEGKTNHAAAAHATAPHTMARHAPSGHAAAAAGPFECQTQFNHLAAAMRAYEQVQADPSDSANSEDAGDDEDNPEAAISYQPTGVRVFGFEADELDLIVGPDGLELAAFVDAPYDEVVRATAGHAARLGLPKLTVDTTEDGETVISCLYVRGTMI